MNITIKPSYLVLGAALFLTACSQDNMPGHYEGENNRIVFRTSLSENATRADVLTKDNLPYFYVTAFDFEDPTLIKDGVMEPHFANEKVNVISGDKAYTSPKCCWPDQNKESHQVCFFGFYPGLPEISGTGLENTSTDNTVDYKLNRFRVAEDIADQVDFITAYTTGSMADNFFKGIILPFAHQLSRIEVKAYGEHKSCDIEIAGVRIGGIGVESTFDFKPIEGGGQWSGSPTRGIVEYIFREGDKIVSCGKNHPIKAGDAISIMGSKRADNNNCAMIIPSTYNEWDYATDCHNSNKQMYISVLLRVTDATLTAGINPTEKQRYPYRDLSQGAQSLSIPIEYLAVNKATGEVITRLYKNGNNYYTDSKFNTLYTVDATEEVKEFGWAALPVKATWIPGYTYTYTLDYTHGVGLHDPEVTTTAPGAGEPVISDKVGITYTVKEWKNGGGNEFPVPGS